MWDILLQAAAGILIGAAVGYGVAAIIEAISKKFADFWEELVATAKEIWGYVTEATQHYLALVAQYLDNNWSEITDWLRKEVGYARSWIVALLAEDNEAYLVFTNSQEQSGVISLGPVKDSNVQLATSQNPMVTVLELS
jgi:hypothetical protein